MSGEGPTPARGAAPHDAGLERLNRAPPADAEERLLSCCGSRAWARAMAARRPFRDRDELLRAADEVWWGLGPDDWLEAFAAHPRIGERAAGADAAAESRGSHEGDGARERAPGADAAARWSAQEQAGAASAEPDTLRALEEGNRRYEERFGHVFLIRAAGRSAVDMLSALTERMSNDPEAELRVAAAQQAEITRLRLARLAQAE